MLSEDEKRELVEILDLSKKHLKEVDNWERWVSIKSAAVGRIYKEKPTEPQVEELQRDILSVLRGILESIEKLLGTLREAEQDFGERGEGNIGSGKTFAPDIWIVELAKDRVRLRQKYNELKTQWGKFEKLHLDQVVPALNGYKDILENFEEMILNGLPGAYIRTIHDRFDKKIESKTAGLEALIQKLDERLKHVDGMLDALGTQKAIATSNEQVSVFGARARVLSDKMSEWLEKLEWSLRIVAVAGCAGVVTVRYVSVSASDRIFYTLLSMIVVGACIWFAWLSTKQIGHYFRLAEDYEYKKSIVEFYEGLLPQSKSFGMAEELHTLLFNQLDKTPVRLMEQANHGSPWHELAANLFREAMKDKKLLRKVLHPTEEKTKP